MDSNFIFTGDYPEPLKQWIRDEVNHAFQKCRTQFGGAPDSHGISRVRIAPGYGGTAHFEYLQLFISPGLEINPNHDGESKALEEIQRLIHHEMVHVFQHHLLGKDKIYALPTWFSEGMAVAFSGQSIIWKPSDFKQELTAFNSLPDAETYLLMQQHEPFDMKSAPFDSLYDIWGIAFIYSIAEGERMHPDYKKTDGPHLSSEELLRAVAIVRDTPELGFPNSLQKHSNKQSLTLSSLDNVICAFMA